MTMENCPHCSGTLIGSNTCPFVEANIGPLVPIAAPVLRCHDCRTPYEEHGLDCVLPDEQWQLICPEGGVLCGRCIARRAERLNGTTVVRMRIETVDEARHRRDGWPLCPRCGEDELMSQVPVSISIKAQPTDRMKCLRCAWEGVVPPR